MTDITIDRFIEDMARELKPSSRTPLYEQLAHVISRAIRSGTLSPGTMLPPEPELAERLGLSRQTVNQALVGLARRGLVNRRRGVGTFVTEPYVEQPLGGLYSFLRTLTAQGRTASMRLLGYRITFDEDVSPLLAGRRDGLVFELSRLRLVDGAPFVVETIYLPTDCGERIPFDRLAQEALYDLLREICGIAVTHAEETLRPVNVEQPDAALLGVSPGEAVFLVERTGYAGDRPVELRRSLIRGDRYRFRVRLEGSGLTMPRE